MELKDFLSVNRCEIDEHINGINPGFNIDDAERELWIFNDAYLYSWAKEEGVIL